MIFPAAPLFAALRSPSAAWPGIVGGRIGSGVRTLVVVGSIVLLAALLGLASRHTVSVSFWPANAVLAGLMLRCPSLNRCAGWLGALIGHVAADLLFGRDLSLALFFAAANLLGTLTATAFLMRLEPADLGLRRIHSVLRILAALLPGCLAAGLCGALLVTVEFGGSASQALMTWPASDLVNYLVVLPAMLTVPFARTLPTPRRNAKWWPALLLALSCAAAIGFDGPGSIMFPMPALLLCALTYSVPLAALITMALGIGCLTAIGMGFTDIGQDMADPRHAVSVRIAVAFLVLVPLTISSATAVRDDLLSKLREAADQDGLTGLLNRRAFEREMQQRLAAAPRRAANVAVLWLDIDHFKAINDRHGHLAGDAMLQMFAATARACCGSGDLVARLGGEEFALVAAAPDGAAAAAIADRLRSGVAAQTLLWNGKVVRATVSIAACHLRHVPDDIPGLFKRLDEALYRAKRTGRNRVEWLTDTAASPEQPSRRTSIG